MLIGIDLLGIQSPDGGSRESDRIGLQLVSALLARDSGHRFVLYVREGQPTERIPTARNALRVSLPAGLEGQAGPRSPIQRVIDQNPDGLDWLLLLDPFEGGFPPEPPLDGLKVASLIADLDPTRVDDRRLARLRRHDAILALGESTASECLRRLPTAAPRLERLGLAVDDSWAGSEADGPFTGVSGLELGRLGIAGPFLFANLASGAGRSNLAGVLEAYHRLPFEHRVGHQLVVAGELDDPWAAVAYLHDRGCSDGLVLVGPVAEPTLRTLYRRCSAFLSPGFAEASTLSLAEAMACASPVIAGRAGSQPDVLAGAGLLADPDDPSEIAEQAARVLSDPDLARDLRRMSRVRSADFAWEPVVGRLLAVLERAEPNAPRRRLRFDRPHVARRRIAVVSTGPMRPTGDLDDRLARACLASHDVDLYVDPSDASRLRRLPVEIGGFDARQFPLNDDILGYDAVLYLLPDVFSLEASLGRLDDRPGLVLLGDEASLDRIDAEGPASIDVEAEVACGRLLGLFSTPSLIAVRSQRGAEAIRSRFPEFADRVLEMPPIGGDGIPRRASLHQPESPGRPEALDELIEECVVALSRGLRRTWRGQPGRMLGGQVILSSTTVEGESYLETR